MDLYKAFATDKRAESAGRKLVLQPHADPKKVSFLLIARKGNALYKTYLSKVLQENQAMLGTKSPEAEILAQGIFRDAMARHILLGWQCVDWPEFDANGEPTGTLKKNVPYSVEQARAMLDVDDFHALVDGYCSDMSNYRSEEVAKEAKNSATT